MTTKGKIAAGIILAIAFIVASVVIEFAARSRVVGEVSVMAVILGLIAFGLWHLFRLIDSRIE